MKITIPSSMLKRLDSLSSAYYQSSEVNIKIDKKSSVIFSSPSKIDKILSDEDKVYIPSNTGTEFSSNDSFIRLVMGPYGSGKTTMCLQEIIKRSCEMPKWSSGRRRCRWAISRNTTGELFSTTLQSWLNWASTLGTIKKRQKPILTYEHHFNDGKGIVELEILFIPLDRPEDVRKIKSLELTGVYLNELSEMPMDVLTHFKARVNRYPPKKFCKEPYWSGIIADTNPPANTHWIHDVFEKHITKSYKIFKQPPGLKKDDKGRWYQNPLCDNYEHLSSDYYEKLAENQSEDFIKVYCLGEYGVVKSGKVVFPEYNTDLHSVFSLLPIPGIPIHLGWDFGLTPACIVIQIAPNGQIRVLKEFTTDRMGLRGFIEHIVKPGILKHFEGYKIEESEADPSGMSSDQIIEGLTPIGELTNLGIATRPAYTNDLQPRLASIRFFLNSLIDGKPGIIVSREGCPLLHEGLAKEYFYKKLAVPGDTVYKESPEKNKYSHICDALQYILMKFAADKIRSEPLKRFDYSQFYNPIAR